MNLKARTHMDQIFILENWFNDKIISTNKSLYRINYNLILKDLVYSVGDNFITFLKFLKKVIRDLK